VSGLHATIRFADGAYILEDNGSRHGTKVNGKPVTTHRLSHNDVIQVVGYSLRFEDTSAFPAAAPRLDDIDNLRLLLGVTRQINSSLALNEVLDHVIDAVIQATRGERGFLMMIGPDGELENRVARNLARKGFGYAEDAAVSRSVVNRVRATARPVAVSDVLNDASLLSSDSIQMLGLRSLMCVPLMIQDRLIGVVYVDSHKPNQFSETDLDLFESMAGQAAVAIEKGQLHEQLRRYSDSLEQQVRERTQALVEANESLKRAYDELQQAQAEILQAEKQATVGRLAAGIAHEINGPLGVLSSSVDLLGQLARQARSENGNAAADEIVADIGKTSLSAIARLQRIVQTFKAFSGLDAAEWKAVGVNQAIEDTLAMIEHSIPDRIRITRNLGALQPVWCSPGRLCQAILNVLTNALQSIDAQGVVEIRTEQEDESVRITIRDSGRGMTPEQLARAFDPGFSAKRDRVGASLGLVVTGQIVRDHHGTIRLDSTPGAGTTVVMSFPNEGLPPASRSEAG
jgi:signal transduction histidine kinase